LRIERRGDVLKGFRTLFEAGTIAGLTDAELLERSKDRTGAAAELAFSALVERHGPMVLRVCRKALGDPHDAHDAFQSTFLILARKGDSIRDKRAVASWLHGVALRVSAASLAADSRRRKHERRKAGGATLATSFEPPDDLGVVLHEEVRRLPGRYRDAVVLCYLEGRSCEEAAGHLRCPVGTVKSRLSWARERLRDRLTRRGLGPAAGAVATMLAAESAHASMAVPASWVESTASASMKFAAIGSGVVPGSAAALAKGVIHAMLMTKFKVATAALAGLVLTGASLMAQFGPAQFPQEGPARASEPERDRLRSMEAKLDRLISALEKQAERQLPPPRVEPSGAIYGPAIPIEPVPAPRALAATLARVARPEGDSIEQRLSRLEERMDRLEQRLMSTPRPDRPPVGRYAPGALPEPSIRSENADAQPAVAPAAPALPAIPGSPAAAGRPAEAPAPPVDPAPPEAPAPPPVVPHGGEESSVSS